MRHFLSIALCFGLFAIPVRGEEKPFLADLALVGGKIWTVNKKQPEVEAIAIRKGRIVAVGSTAEIKRLVGPRTVVLDLNGKRVLPGFYDSHCHLLGSGLQLSRVNLKDAKDQVEFGKRLRAFDKKLPKDRWLLGGNWDHDRTFNGKLPTAAMLDQYVKDRPVFIRRYDGHMALANSRAMNLAGITAKTPDPVGGVIYRKAGTKVPTGLLRDNAMGMVSRLIPPTSAEEMAEAIRAVLKEAARLGVTSAQDMDGSGADARTRLFRLYQRLARSGRLTLRVGLRWPLASWKELAAVGIESGFGNEWLFIAGVKGFIDGSLGSSTAKMFKPYINEPDSTGVFVTPLSRLRESILAADKAGINVAVHAIGDRGNAELLDIYEEVQKLHGKRDRRFRVEHAQHLRPEDIPRFGKLGVIPSMQPYHIIDDGRWAEGRIGAKRCASSYANRGLLDTGAILAFGSDWSVAPLNPLLGIDAAVNRRTLNGKHPKGWFPGQKISVAEAIEAYTYGSAYAAFQEKEKGTLEVGKLADLVVLSRDILHPKAKDAIASTKVVLTIVGGKIVHRAKSRE